MQNYLEINTWFFSVYFFHFSYRYKSDVTNYCFNTLRKLEGTHQMWLVNGNLHSIFSLGSMMLLTFIKRFLWLPFIFVILCKSWFMHVKVFVSFFLLYLIYQNKKCYAHHGNWKFLSVSFILIKTGHFDNPDNILT